MTTKHDEDEITEREIWELLGQTSQITPDLRNHWDQVAEREQKYFEAIVKAIGWLGAEEISREEIREFLRKEIEPCSVQTSSSTQD